MPSYKLVVLGEGGVGKSGKIFKRRSFLMVNGKVD